MSNHEARLRADVRTLGELLGESLVRQSDQSLLDLVEQVRLAVRDSESEIDVSALISNLPTERKMQLARAFTTYFNLANVAEQVHRTRSPHGAWISKAMARIKEGLDAARFTDAELKEWIAHLEIRPVFTAHPTEAARRSVLSKLKTVSTLLEEEPSDRRDERLAEMIDLLWQTDELRLERPEIAIIGDMPLAGGGRNRHHAGACGDDVAGAQARPMMRKLVGDPDEGGARVTEHVGASPQRDLDAIAQHPDRMRRQIINFVTITAGVNGRF